MPTTAYCYVDESGVSNTGEPFIVGIVVVDPNQEPIRKLCERIEQTSGKARVKWGKAKYERKLAYMQEIINTSDFVGRLFFATFHNTKKYDDCTVRAIAATLRRQERITKDAVVIIDALPAAKITQTTNKLRQYGIHPKKVRGIDDEQTSALLRLADALCGLVRAAYREQSEMKQILDVGISTGVITFVSPC